jgi:Kdo2-lipid IVA lauroyltransferase/acyltransferase
MLDFIYQSAALAGGWIGFENASRLGDLAGDLLWHVLPARRKVAVAAVSERLGLEREQARQVARQSFRHTGRSFLETFLTRRVDWRFLHERVTFEPPGRFETMLRTQGPAIMTTAHVGAWELFAGVMALCVKDRPMGVLVREGKDRALNRMLRRQRGRPGIEVIGHRNAALAVLRLLRKGGGCAFLVDHNAMQREAVFIPFLGKAAAVNAGPALLALRAGATIWPCFMLRRPEGGYLLETHSPLLTRELQGAQQEKVATVAAFYTAAVEDVVRRHPEQWLWMHKRWKTRPHEEDAQ